jgi:tetratricopeptide (TPR) repeat protein
MNHNTEPARGQSRYSTPHRIVALFFLIVGLTIYSNTFQVPPHLDDVFIYADSTLEALLSRLTLSNTRLVADATFAFNYWLAGPNVLGYHIFNLIIHVLTAFLVYQLLFQTLQLTSKEQHFSASDSPAYQDNPPLPPISDHIFWGSFFGGIIFLVHPLATQSVTYITQRYTSLAALFYVGTIVCYLKARMVVLNEESTGGKPLSLRLFLKRGHLFWYCLAVSTAILAMYTKEMCITLPVMLILVEFCLVQSNFEKIGRRLLYLLPFLASGFIIPVNHLPVLRVPETVSTIETTTASDKILPRWAGKEYLTRSTYFFSQIGIIWSIYLRLLVWPWGQNIEHDFFVSNTLFHTTTLVAFLGLLSLLAVAALTIKRYRLLGFGILWFFLTLSVTSSIITNTIFVAEHRVYLAMTGLTFVMAGICRYLKRPRIFWSLAIPIMLVLSVLTFMRNHVWKDDLTLWADALEKSPNMSRPYVNYARALQGLGRLEESIALYEKVVSMPAVPYKSDLMHKLYALGNLGTIYTEKGMYQQALSCYQAAAQMTAPLHASDMYFNMGNVFAKLKQYPEALDAYQKAVENNPGNYRAYTNLGWVLMTLDRHDEAEAAFRKALKYNQRSAETYLNLAILYSKEPHKRATAITHYKKYMALEPDPMLRERVGNHIRQLEAEDKRQQAAGSGQ